MPINFDEYCKNAETAVICAFHSFSCRGEFFVFGLQGSITPIVEKRTWDIRAFNYDNCAAAMITLFAVQTSEGWVE